MFDNTNTYPLITTTSGHKKTRRLKEKKWNVNWFSNKKQGQMENCCIIMIVESISLEKEREREILGPSIEDAKQTA